MNGTCNWEQRAARSAACKNLRTTEVRYIVTANSNKRKRLADIGEELARRPFHGKTVGLRSNIRELTDHFPGDLRSRFNKAWCAAFVFHCCKKAGFHIPPRHPKPVSCSFAGVLAWIEWGKLADNRFYFARQNLRFYPERGDIVVYDHVYVPGPHDHMGIILEVRKGNILAAEGNINDISSVVRRDLNAHIRGYIRIPEEYRYEPG